MDTTLRLKHGLIVRSSKPFNAETPPARVRASMITAVKDFYVRCHGDIPVLEETTHRLRVDGKVTTRLDLSLADLRTRFQQHTVTAVLQCAGNRRGDMHRLRPVSGDSWSAGAIGNARWTGASLSDVLQASGAADGAGLHVAMAASDMCDGNSEPRRYVASIPMTKAMSAEVLLAYEMNGAPLQPEHGFPLRAVVPGFAGVRSPKWLAAVTVQDQPADSDIQSRDYKLFPSDVTDETVDWNGGITIYDMPLNAAICEPGAGTELKAGLTTLRGYAIATARTIERVDISADGGRSWQQAELECAAGAPWSWTFWQAALDLPRGEHELVVRAWDSAGQTQPERLDSVWNFKGYLTTAWHRVTVNVS